MKLKHNELESDIESDIRQYGERRGWLVFKFVCPGQTGVPDRLFIRRGRHVFIEIKKLGEKPTAKQRSKHAAMREHGAEVYVVDNLEDAMEILR